MSVDAKAAAALTGSAELLAKLVKGKSSVYHNKSPDAGSYPVLVYRTISASPKMHADGVLWTRQATVRVTILTADGVSSDIKDLVYAAMTAAGFMWEMTAPGNEDGRYYDAMDFTMAEEVRT